MYMRLTLEKKRWQDMFEQMSKEEQEIMIELAKKNDGRRTLKELVKEIKQRLTYR